MLSDVIILLIIITPQRNDRLHSEERERRYLKFRSPDSRLVLSHHHLGFSVLLWVHAMVMFPSLGFLSVKFKFWINGNVSTVAYLTSCEIKMNSFHYFYIHLGGQGSAIIPGQRVWLAWVTSWRRSWRNTAPTHLPSFDLVPDSTQQGCWNQPECVS